MDRFFFDKKNVLITGHTGFKGTWLTLIMKMLGANVVGYSNDVLDGESLYALINCNEIKDIRGDICDIKSLETTIKENKIDYVFHFAAQTIVKNGIENPFETFRTNTMGTVCVLEAIRKSEFVKGAVIATTDKVYDTKSRHNSFEETDVIGGRDPYAASKSCAELAFDAYKRTYYDSKNTGTAVVRAGNVIGGGDFAPYRIIPDCMRAYKSQEPLYLRRPHYVRPYQHVLDALMAYINIMQFVSVDPRHSGSFNVGPDVNQNCKTIDILQIMNLKKCF